MRSWTGVLDGLFFSLSPLWRLLIIALLMALMIIVSRRKRFLTWGGCAAAALLGLVVMYISGISGIVLLLFFFLSSSIVSHLSRRLDYIAEKGDERDMMQVAANGIPAALSILLYRISPYHEAFIIAFAAAIAEAEADTFSGEIGRLSHSDPVSILTFTKVPKGLSGGITVLGLAAGAASSFLIALLFMGTFGSTFSSLLIIASSGFLGSVFDSLLGACAMGDIGKHFPDNDDRFKDADSMLLLKEVVKLIKSKGFSVNNIDATVIAQSPKLAPYIDLMRKNIAGVIGIELSAVSVKATTEERLGFTGALEGIAAHCVCITEQKDKIKFI